MSLHLTLAGSGTATEHQRGTMSISRSMNAISTLTVRVKGAKGVPTGGMEVGAFLGTDKPFGGVINQVKRARVGNSARNDTYYDLLCQGWEHRLTARIIQARIYSSLNAGAVVLDLLDTELSGEGIIAGTIEDGLAAEDLGVIQFIGSSVYQAIDELAVRCNFNWWITDKVLNFRSKDTITAGAIVFSDANKNVLSLNISETGEDYVNVVKIMIGWDQVGATVAPDFIGDGSAQTFTIADVGGEEQKIDHVTEITLNAVVQTIGILGVDLDAQWWWALGSNVITQNSADPAITSADTLSVSYFVLGRNVIVEEDADEIAARITIEGGGSGRYELFVDDSQNSDQVGAQNKALAILDKRCPGRNGAPAGTWPKVYDFTCYSYVTDSADLIPGNVIKISKTCPDTDGEKEVLIQSVESREMVGLDPDGQNGYFQHTIKAVDYVPVDDHRDFLRALGGASIGGGSSAGGGVPQERYERYVFGIEVPVVGTLVTQKNTVERESGVRLIRWRITANDAPTGSSFIMDIMRNGTSIFPSGDANKIVLPASLLKNKGVTFVTDPIELDYEDELVPDILQVGSTSAGYQIQVQITAAVR